MSNQENAIVLSKAKISQFVHDAADMEKSEYTLTKIRSCLLNDSLIIKGEASKKVRLEEEEVKKAESDLERETKQLDVERENLENAKKRMIEAERNYNRLFAGTTVVESKSQIGADVVDEYGNNIQKIAQNKDQYEKYKAEMGSGVYEIYRKNDGKNIEKRFSMVKLVIGMIIASILAAGGAGSAMDNDIENPALFMLITVLVLNVIWFTIYFKGLKKSKKHKKMFDFMYEYDNAVEIIENTKKAYSDAKENLDKCELAVNNRIKRINDLRAEVTKKKKNLDLVMAEREVVHSKAKWMVEQAQKIKNILETIGERKQRFYEIGIIPPDYRTLDATLMIANIFDNDLADTMREAVLLYDERVFRGEVVRGVDNINKSLDKLNNTMGAVVGCLNSINTQIRRAVLEINGVANQIHSMNCDMLDMSGKILDAQNSAASNQSAALEEARAMRYATEELTRSQEIVSRYVEDRRNGLI